MRTTSVSDVARYKNPDGTDDLIRNWIRNRNTIDFLGIWEQLNNPNFNPLEIDGFRKKAGLKNFTLTPKQWIEKTRARGIIAKSGRYGGTGIPVVRGTSSRGSTHPGPKSSPMTCPGTLFRSHSPKNRPLVFRGA
ncbi:MAG: hypothetical protein CVV32_06265 [Methanomicrobiales archaeon HGW-Methanomicrobiales-3]|jgi:hypothetical protein|nr:MAG: hypothetical protein CVV32_06265 [Methanomicrobiales archaeon HGW-Methanomicrobiales-3]